jgi:hypothetical protein
MASNLQKSLFIDKLYSLTKEARQTKTKVAKGNVLRIWSQHSYDEMELIDEEGHSFLSYGDVIMGETLLFISDSVKQLTGKDQLAFCSVDAMDNTPLHYAAMFGLDEIFESIPFSDNAMYRHMCEHVNKNNMHTVVSLLIEKDNIYSLQILIEKLKLSPLSCDVNGIYFSWLHEAIFNNAEEVVMYLINHHRDEIQRNIKLQLKEKDFSLLDVVLLSKFAKQRHFYIDVILSNFQCGLNLNIIPFSHLLLHKRIGSLSREIESILPRCICDSLLNKCQFELSN